MLGSHGRDAVQTSQRSMDVGYMLAMSAIASIKIWREQDPCSCHSAI